MKKLFLLIAMMSWMFTGNVDAAKIDYSKNVVNMVYALSDSLSLADFTDSLYTIDLNETKTNRISELFKLDSEQKDMLNGVHTQIAKDFNELNYISNDIVKENKFNKIIRTWRKGAYKVFMNGEHRYDLKSRHDFRFYWALVATTLNNKGITSYGEFVANPKPVAVQ